MKNILVLIGSSENTRNTLQYGLDLAKRIGGNIFALRANSLANAASMKDINTLMIRESELYVKSVIKLVDTKGVPVKTITCKGNVLASIRLAVRQLGVDLIVLGAKSHALSPDLFLSPLFGSIIQNTSIPALIVPEKQVFHPYKNALIATKSGVVNKKDALDPLKNIIHFFSPLVNLLLVKTPNTIDKDSTLDPCLKEMTKTVVHSEANTTYLGVQKYLQTNDKTYDLLCVFRRKKGFFKKLWTKNAVMRKDFDTSLPLLVLSGEN